MGLGLSRICRYIHPTGEPCRAHPLTDDEWCFWHSPTRKADLAEAQELGRARRRRESTVAAAYDLEGLSTPDDYGRVIEIGLFDTLSLPNSVPRNRTLGFLVAAGLKCWETGDTQARLAALEGAVGRSAREEPSVFEVEPLDEDEDFPGEGA
jgi:hypothetical protein